MPPKKGKPAPTKQQAGSDKSGSTPERVTSEIKKQALQNVNAKNSSVTVKADEITPPRKLSPLGDSMSESMDSSFGDFSLATIHNIISANIEQYNMNLQIAERNRRLEHEGIGFKESEEEHELSSEHLHSDVHGPEAKLEGETKMNTLLGIDDEEPEQPRTFVPPSAFEPTSAPPPHPVSVTAPTSYSIELMNAQMDRIFQRNQQLAAELLLDNEDSTLQASARGSTNDRLPEDRENDANDSFVTAEEGFPDNQHDNEAAPEDVDFDQCLNSLDQKIDHSYEVIRSTLEAESQCLRASADSVSETAVVAADNAINEMMAVVAATTAASEEDNTSTTNGAVTSAATAGAAGATGDVEVDTPATSEAESYVPPRAQDVDFDECLNSLDQKIDHSYEVIRSTLEAESLYLRASADSVSETAVVAADNAIAEMMAVVADATSTGASEEEGDAGATPEEVNTSTTIGGSASSASAAAMFEEGSISRVEASDTDEEKEEVEPESTHHEARHREASDHQEEEDEEPVAVMDSLSTAAALGRRTFSEPTVSNETTIGGRSSINDYHAYLTLNAGDDPAAPAPFLDLARRSFEREELNAAVSAASTALGEAATGDSNDETVTVNEVPQTSTVLPPMSFDTLTGSTNYLPPDLPASIEVPTSLLLLQQTASHFNAEVLQTADDEVSDDYIARAYKAIKSKHQIPTQPDVDPVSNVVDDNAGGDADAVLLRSSVTSLPPGPPPAAAAAAPPLTSLEESVTLPSAALAANAAAPFPSAAQALATAAGYGDPLSKSLMSDLLTSVNEENMDDYISRAYKAIRNKVVTEHHQQEYDRRNPLYNSVAASTADLTNTLPLTGGVSASSAKNATVSPLEPTYALPATGVVNRGPSDSDPLSTSLVEFINQKDDEIEGAAAPPVFSSTIGGSGMTGAASARLVSSAATASAAATMGSEMKSPRQDINSLLHDIAESLNDGITVSPSYLDFPSPGKYSGPGFISSPARRSSEFLIQPSSPERRSSSTTSAAAAAAVPTMPTSPFARAPPAPLRGYADNSSISGINDSTAPSTLGGVEVRPGSARAAPVTAPPSVQGIVSQFLGNKPEHKYHPLDTKLDYFPSSSSTSTATSAGAGVAGAISPLNQAKVEPTDGGEDMDALKAQLQSTKILIDYKFFLEATRMNKRRIAMGHEILLMLQQHNEAQQKLQTEPHTHDHTSGKDTAPRQVPREEGITRPTALDTFSVDDDDYERQETEDFVIVGKGGNQDEGDSDIEPRSVKSIEEPLRRSLTSPHHQVQQQHQQSQLPPSASSKHGRFIPGHVPNDSSGIQSILRASEDSEMFSQHQQNRPSTGGSSRAKSPHMSHRDSVQQQQQHHPQSGFVLAPSSYESGYQLPTPPTSYRQPSPSVPTAPAAAAAAAAAVPTSQQQYLYQQKASPLSPSRMKYAEHQAAAQQLIKQNRWDLDHHQQLQLPQVVYHAPIHPPQAPHVPSAGQQYDPQQLHQLHQYQQQQQHRVQHQQQFQQPPPPLPYDFAPAPPVPTSASNRPPNPVDQVIVIPVSSHPTGPPPVLRSQSAGRNQRRASAPTDLPTVPEEPSPARLAAAAAAAVVGGIGEAAEPEIRKERPRSVSAGRGGSGVSNTSKHTNYPQTKNAISCVCLAGSHFEQKRNEVLDLLDFYSGAGNSRAAKDFSSVQHLIELGHLKDRVTHFILMFYKSNIQALKGVYAIDPMTEAILRIYGTGPRELPRAGESSVTGVIQGYMKYETSTKSFKTIPVKGVSSAVDAVIIDPAKAQKHKLSL